ncbi:MAG TPA: tripartite tricarboxylate transporter substrate-binding protein [Burkholderiales bacterium]|nr:tripartite tricarboxylate transporter substrate-binding protein [Burkholderiales bacterium]
MWRLLAGTVTGMCIAAGAARAQEFPAKVVRVVTGAPGGNNDFIVRLISPIVSAALGQQMIVENRGGLAAELVSKAPADGYTLLSYGTGVWLGPLMRETVGYDPARDLLPVTLLSSSPNILVVHPSLPVKNVKDLIALARARPGDLNYAAGTLGATPHLAAELFKSMTGVSMVNVAYKGTGPAMNALIAGETHVMFPTSGSVRNHLGSGRLRALGIATLKPSLQFPELPLIAATVPGYQSAGTIGLYAPSKTPPAIIGRLNREVVRAINVPDVKQRLLAAGVEPIGNTPEEALALMKSEVARLGKVIKDANIRGPGE